MANALLLVPHFWDPVCVPLGISSLKAHAERHGHRVHLFDFNTVHDVFGIQREYFEEGKRQFPQWHNWNIERNGTEMLSLHQLVYLFGRGDGRYRKWVGEILNLDGRSESNIHSQLESDRFDVLFARLYDRVGTIIKNLLSTLRPDVVGCSLFNSTWPAALFILNEVRKHNPTIRTVLGGPGALMGIASRREEVEHLVGSHPSIDYYVLGEAEDGLVQILDDPSLERGILTPRVKGEHRAAISNGPSTPELEANYGELLVGKYLQLSVSSSRGCPFACSFCAETVFWDGFHSIDAKLLVQRMSTLASQYGRTAFYICDSLSNHIITPLTAQLHDMKLSYKLDCYLRPDRTCADLVKTNAWRKGGLVRARLGMESASQRILDRMEKRNTVQAMAQSLYSLAEADIATSTLWIVGYPGEDDSDFSQTLRFIGENRASMYQADAWLFQYHPTGLPGSSQIEAEHGSRPRFSSDLCDLLRVKPYSVCGLSSEERFQRLHRFVARMRELKIPNPYSLYEWIGAESRWESLGHRSGWKVTGDLLAVNE